MKHSPNYRSLAGLAAIVITSTACAGAVQTAESQEDNAMDVQSADMVVVNGTIWTGVAGAADAQAVAVRDGRIVAVGTDAAVRPLVGSGTRVVDAHGGMVVPGFIDTHVHFIDGGFPPRLRAAARRCTPQEFVARIRVRPHGAQRHVDPGGDWDHTNWGGELPTRNGSTPSRRTTRSGSTAWTATWRWPTRPHSRPPA
jgi:hypothetical protein